MGGGFQGNLSDADQATVRQRALQALKDYRDRGCTLPKQPDAALVQEMMNFMVGERVGDEYVPMMQEELALDGNDSRAPRWTREVPAATREKFHVLVIGAGMSGLLQALRLKEAGIPFTVVEKNDSVGGTWYENQYPGCRVDIANHFYSYSFEPYPWTEYFSPATSCGVLQELRQAPRPAGPHPLQHRGAPRPATTSSTRSGMWSSRATPAVRRARCA